MLRYMNRGVRMGPNPHPVGVPRGNWEIFAVVAGRIRLVYPDAGHREYQSRRIWLLPPESLHSWATEPGQRCRIMVFHFASIHPALENSLPPGRTLSIALENPEARLLESLQRELAPHYRSPSYSSCLHFEAAMLRLGALFLDRNFEVVTLPGFDPGSEIVLRAEQWHRSRMRDGAGVNDVAAGVGVSPSHLRRLFMRIRGESPKRVFMRAKLQEACRLMAQSNLNLKEVAGRCGFCGFSEFHRAFKHHTGQSPSRWRSNQLYGGLGITTNARRRDAPEGARPQSGGSQVNRSAPAD